MTTNLTKPKMNRLANCNNTFQGSYKKVLCVCSAGMLRSPTAAHILSSSPYNFNTRAVGTAPEYALIPIDEALIVWADIIICMDDKQAKIVSDLQKDILNSFTSLSDFVLKPVYNLNIEDDYEYRNPHLVKSLEAKFKELFKENKGST